MPPFDYLGSAKLKELLGYLRTLQGKGSQVALPGNAANGKVLFFGKARCSECHMVQGTGGFLGRDLSAYGATLSPVEIRSNILKTSSASNRANQTAVVTMRDAHEFKGVIRNEDNFSIQLQSFDGAFHFLTTADVAHVDFLPEPIMPANYDKTLTSPELDDLVSYLATVSRVGRGGKNFKEEDDD
jgi:putative heme-binding domain-containing protein